MNTIRALYSAEINKTQETAEKTETQIQQDYAYNELINTFSKKQKDLFLQFLDFYDYDWANKCEEMYRKGFQTGVKLWIGTLIEN